jgi:hypothetical protein
MFGSHRSYRVRCTCRTVNVAAFGFRRCLLKYGEIDAAFVWRCAETFPI